MKRLLLILTMGILTAMPLASRPVYAASASMYLSPASGSWAQGSVSYVSVSENSGGEPVNAASFTLSYPADKLTFVSTSAVAFPIVAASSGGGGSVHFEGGRLPPAVSGAQRIATVGFRPKVNSGTAPIAITGGSVLSANSNQDISGGKSGGTYTLTNAPVAAPKDTIPPTIKDVKSSDITASSVTITWTSSEPATSEVFYGLNKGYGLTANDANLVTAHKVVLNSALITPGTAYHYMVKSVDPAGNAVSSADSTFMTKGATLIATVTDQHGKAIKGAKVSFGDINAMTGSKGEATLNNLPLGKQVGTVSYRNKQTVVNVEIKPIDPKGAPQRATFKINPPSNLIWVALVPLLALLLFAAWWIGREEGEGINPFKAVMAKVRGRSPGRGGPKKGGPSNPLSGPPTSQPPPTIIKPGG